MPEFTAGKSPQVADLRKEAPAPLPSIGRIVRYVTEDGAVRPAIILDTGGEDAPNVVDLEVFGEPLNDPEQPRTPGAVVLDENQTPGTWHWPPRG